MSKTITINGAPIPVSDEVYATYYQSDRRMRYMEHDVKIERAVKKKTGETIYHPAKEDSFDRLYETGKVFADDTLVEDIVCDKAELLLLHEAMSVLDESEVELVNAIYQNNRTYRDVAATQGVSHTAIKKRHDNILVKLKNFF